MSFLFPIKSRSSNLVYRNAFKYACICFDA